jgi:lipopolysaccharide transport system permease protein
MKFGASRSHAEPTVGYVVDPYRPWTRIPWAELVDHRDLLFLLVRRDVVSRYKQTVLGPAWYVLQPLLMSVVFTVVFSRVSGISTDGVPRMLFYLGGQLGWNYFVLNLNRTAGTFTSNAHIFGKVYFPRLIVPLAAVTSNLLALALQLGVFLLFVLGFKLFASWTGHGIGWSVLLLPVLVVQTAALSLGVGLWIASLTVKYRDLAYAMSFLTSVWMFLTPVFYPLSQIDAASRWIFLINPMTAVVESYRLVLLGVGTVDTPALLSSAAMTVAVLLTGVLVFQRTERTAMDTI